jgi:glycosyltransferase involved in cell wall biosynthesis
VINQTIDSFFDQTLEDFEVVIVDDGSTDETDSILNEIDDERFKIMKLRCRHGAGFARNVGNLEAHAPIICVVDCGDVLLHNKAEVTLDYFVHHNDVDIMCSATQPIAGGNTIKPRLFRGDPGEKLGFEHPGVAYKKHVTDKIKYRTTSLETDQYDAFFFECARAGFKFGIYEEPLSLKCTFSQYTGGRNLDEALMVKAGIYREFNIPLPEWLEEHERRFKCQTKKLRSTQQMKQL